MGSKLANMLHAGKDVKVFIDWMNARRTCGQRIFLENIGYNWLTMSRARKGDGDDDNDDDDCNVYCRLEQSFLGQIYELRNLLETGEW